MIITFISDTHTKHKDLNLPGGDLLIHSGDIMNDGNNIKDVISFLNWFSTQKYTEVIFIAGNHDRMFESNPHQIKEILNTYIAVNYLEDDWVNVNGVTIYGSPWQPAFGNWAFNLPRLGIQLEYVWNNMPTNTDILVTHGPPAGHLDIPGESRYNSSNVGVGCELLRSRVDLIKPKIHVFGHIHGSYGYKFSNNTHFFNAAVLNENYNLTNKPITIDWDILTNTLDFIK
jgi:Icc-related predicted phosphoesterase